jgi:hypothetical protein
VTKLLVTARPNKDELMNNFFSFVA